MCEDNYYSASEAQKRMFVLSQMKESEIAVHLPCVLIVKGNLNIHKVEYAFTEIINRHEGFRTSFVIKNDEIVQRIQKKVEFTIDYKQSNEGQIENLIKEFIQPFDLSKAPLIKVGIAELSHESYLLYMDFHHIIADGYSVNIVAQEFMSIYKGNDISSVKMQYRDHMKWYQSFLKLDSYKYQNKFWSEKLSGDIPLLNMPIDNPRPPYKSLDGKTLRFKVLEEETKLLKNFAKENGTSLFMLLLAAFNILLSKLSGQQDIIVGTPVVARGHGDFESTVGMLTNNIILRNFVDDNTSIQHFLKEVRKNCSIAYENVDFTFENMVKTANLKTPINRHPLFDVMFIYENANDRVIHLDNLTFTRYDFDLNISLYDFTFEVIEESGTLNLNLYYSTSLYKEQTIIKWIGYFTNIIKDIVNDNTILISEILKDSMQELKDNISKSNTFATNNVLCKLPDTNNTSDVDELAGSGEVALKNIEKDISELWKEVLNINSINAKSNFFELGGRSITAMALVEKLQKNYKLSIMDLFNYPTISQLSRYVYSKTNQLVDGSKQSDMKPKRTHHRKENKKNSAGGYEIAVIGMSGKFPGAKDIDEFWENLKAGRETISFFSDEELIESGIDAEMVKDSKYVKSKGVMEDVEYFDSAFFDYAPYDAERMDPQIRVFHECSWKALENAGYDPDNYDGLIGVFAGSASNYNWMTHIFKPTNNIGDQLEKISLNDKDYMSTRISYKLNLKGPSYTIQTACSTSMATLNLACNSILNGECDMALAGGVSIMLPQKSGYLFQEGLILSEDGHCRPFDANASGTVFGDGVGIVVLKPLKDALEARDNIYAVIKGTAANNDGIRKVGYTAPSIQGQSEVIIDALEKSNVLAETISYIETHGTGTVLGDPIEFEALKQAFATDKRKYCAIGSVKANVGHLDAAAGIAGFIKTVLCLKNRTLVPSINYMEANPKIDFESSPFYLNTILKAWEPMKHPENEGEYLPLRAGVSSFGFGGTNIHTIVEEPPPEMDISLGKNHSDSQNLLVISAKTKSALDRVTVKLREFFEKNQSICMEDVASTLQTGRRHFKHRRMFVCSTANKAAEVIESIDNKKSKLSRRIITNFNKEDVKQLVFMFPGQGSQYINMGCELYHSEEIFKKEMDKCFEILRDLVDYDLKSIIFPDEANAQEARKLIIQTYITQVAIFVFEYSLAKLLIEWGLQPSSMIGHSLGEYAAACISGVFSLEDALKLIVERAKLMQEMSKGSMISVNLKEEQLKKLISQELSIATVNGETNCVVSGSTDAIEKFSEKLKEIDLEYTRLQTSHAFHSEMMVPMLESFENIFTKIRLHAPKIPYISNLTGTWITPEETTDPKYWSRHLRNTVRFYDGVGELLKEKKSVFVEVGPGKTLSSFVNQHVLKTPEQLVINLVRHPKEKISDRFYLLDKIGNIWCAGVNINWNLFNMGRICKKVPLPTYQFLGQRYSLDHILNNVNIANDGNVSSLKKQSFEKWFYRPSWGISSLPLSKISSPLIKSNWLLLVDESGVGDKLAQKLSNEGQDVVIVRIGNEFKAEKAQYIINPKEIDNYEKLFSELSKQSKFPNKLLHMWGIEETQDFEIAMNLYFYSMLYLVQTLGKHLNIEDVKLLAITSNVQTIMGNENVNPLKGVISGACKVIPQEYSLISCRNIDIKIDKQAYDLNSFSEHLYNECLADVNDKNVAYRGNLRFIESFEQTDIHRLGNDTRNLQHKGVYLITGGLGGIGLVLAQHFAETYQAKLILTGRSVFPERNEWERWLSSHLEDDLTSRKIKIIKNMLDNGAEVMVATSDISDIKQMTYVVKSAEEKFGKIDGVIHTAGVPGNGMIQLKTKDTAHKVLLPKIKGTMVLDNLFKNKNLDFMIICSSMASILGEIGQIDYVAANAYIDCYVRQAAFANLSTYVGGVNWDNWEEVGMASEASKLLSDNIAVMLKEGIRPTDGIKAFNCIIESQEPQIIVSVKDLYQQQKIMSESRTGERLEDYILPSEKYFRPELSCDYVAPSTDIEKSIAEIWQMIFGIKNIGINDNFNELGGDSLYALALATAMKKQFKVDITDIYNYPTIFELAEKLSGKSEDLKTKIEMTKKQFKKYFDNKQINKDTEKEFMEYKTKIKKYTSMDISETRTYSSILLTGCTGYLGIYLLIELLEKTISDIYVIIRAENLDSAKQKLKNKLSFYFSEDTFEVYRNRIFILCGQITEDKFGLSLSEYETLVNKIDCVVNSAGKTDHYGKYEDFYKINVEAITKIINFTSNGCKKDIHHISTKGVGVGKVEGKENVLFTEFDIDVGQRIDNYYVETKIKAEKLLVKAREKGINTNIYRIGDIVYDTRTGKFQENIDKNALYLMIRALFKLKVIPQLQLEFMDFTFVDFVSTAIVNLITRKKLTNETYHLQNSKKIGFDSLMNLSKTMNMSMTEMNFEDFLDYLYKNYDSEQQKTYIQDFIVHSHFLESADNSNFILGCEKTNIILEKSNLSWCKPSLEQLKMMYAYGSQVGFF